MSALGLILLWALSGPLLGYSEVWQLTVNTATTIITFLMVFLIQHQQNADTRALHAKMDELIRALPNARNQVINAEGKSDAEIDALVQELRKVGESATHVSLKDG